MLDSTHLEQTLWFFSLASRSKLLTPLTTTITLAFLSLLSFLLISLIFWAHPGGPSWGKHKWTRNLSSRNKPIPGPNGFPIIGSMSIMSGLAHRKIAVEAEACHAKRLMAFSLGETRAIVTCKPDVAKEILTSSNFADRPAKESAYRLMFNRSIGFAPYGAHWTALRKIAAHHLFCPKQVKESENQRKEIANQIVGVLESSSKQRGIIRIRDVLKRASLNNMMWSVFGQKYDLGETDELNHLVEQGYDLLGEVNWSDHLSFLSEWDLQKIRARCDQLVPRVNRLIGDIIADHKTGCGLNRDFVDVLLSLEGADKLSDSDMIAVLWEMIFRGTDTVAALIEWILARLVLHPDVQSKVHAELDNVVGRSATVTESDLPRLVYLSAVVNEVLRMHPPGPLLSWSRLSIRDSTVDGYHVPAGTTAIVNMWAIMRDPEVWADPLNFNPGRFLGKDSEVSVLGSDLRIAPFGAGRRSCPGKTLGLTTVNFWLATILHQFELGSCGSSVDLTEVLKLSCEMVNPLMVEVRPRHGTSVYKS